MNIKEFFFQRERDNALGAKFKSATRVHLSQREYDRGRAFLLEYMRHNPARQPAPSLRVRAPWWAMPVLHPMPILAGILLVVLSSSTAAAAADSLPGDILYPVKIHVNEPLQGALAVSPRARAAWNIELAERRIHESSSVASADSMSSDNATLGSATSSPYIAPATTTETATTSVTFAVSTSSTKVKVHTTISTSTKAKNTATSTKQVPKQEKSTDTEDSHTRSRLKDAQSVFEAASAALEAGSTTEASTLFSEAEKAAQEAQQEAQQQIRSLDRRHGRNKSSNFFTRWRGSDDHEDNSDSSDHNSDSGKHSGEGHGGDD